MPDTPEDPFETSYKQFDTVEEYLDRLKSDLKENGYDIEWGERGEEDGKTFVEVEYQGEVLEGLRVPTNLDVVNKQMGPLTGYDMMLDTVQSALHYDEREGDLPFLNQN